MFRAFGFFQSEKESLSSKILLNCQNIKFAFKVHWEIQHDLSGSALRCCRPPCRLQKESQTPDP